MRSLPRALAPWEEELARLPRDVVRAVGPWLGSLALAIGEASVTTRPGDGEPDGVGALARRGSYERLLGSEWLLADEAPDEFVRRAAAGEHLFLAVARRAPSGSRRVVALFDTGPSQMGAPKLAQIALWIVLARRARVAGARFAWGVLQRPEMALREDLDAAALRALLEARAARDHVATSLDAWLGGGDEEREAWIVGSSRGIARVASRGARTIAIEDPLELDARRLLVHVARAAGRARPLELPLPPDDVCVRVLRDPVRAASAAPAVVPVPRDSLFGFPGDGRRLAVHTKDGFVSWGVPAPRADAGAPKRMVLAERERLVAAGHRGRRLIGIATNGVHLVAIGIGKEEGPGKRRCARGHLPTQKPDAWLDALTSGERFLDVVHGALRADGVPSLAFVGPDRVLVGLWSDAQGRLQQSTSVPDVAAFHPMHSGALVVRTPESGGTHVQIVSETGPNAELLVDPEVRAAVVHFGSFERFPVIAYAVDRRLRTFRVTGVRGERPVELHAPEGTRAIGIHSDRSHQAGLVVIEPGGREVSVIGRRGGGRVARSSAPIHVACTSARGGNVAWRTADGWIEVASIHHAAIVLRIPPEPRLAEGP